MAESKLCRTNKATSGLRRAAAAGGKRHHRRATISSLQLSPLVGGTLERIDRGNLLPASHRMATMEQHYPAEPPEGTPLKLFVGQVRDSALVCVLDCDPERVQLSHACCKDQASHETPCVEHEHLQLRLHPAVSLCLRTCVCVCLCSFEPVVLFLEMKLSNAYPHAFRPRSEIAIAPWQLGLPQRRRYQLALRDPRCPLAMSALCIEVDVHHAGCTRGLAGPAQAAAQEQPGSLMALFGGKPCHNINIFLSPTCVAATPYFFPTHVCTTARGNDKRCRCPRTWMRSSCDRCLSKRGRSPTSWSSEIGRRTPTAVRGRLITERAREPGGNKKFWRFNSNAKKNGEENRF